MLGEQIHAFCDDALGDRDAVELATAVRRGLVSARELAGTARARSFAVGRLSAIAGIGPAIRGSHDAALGGVPTFVKDEFDVIGMTTTHGGARSRGPAKANGPAAAQLLTTGLTVIGKSRMPEFGLLASTEFAADVPARNPWSLRHSCGGSSGGAAALVAAGVVPIAHGSDGGGSLRIPAAACGLVGLKPTRGRLATNPRTAWLPVDIVTAGVLTRSVRDTAAYLAAVERRRPVPRLRPIGLVTGPTRRRLRIGIQLTAPNGATVCPATAAAVDATAHLLEQMGHHVDLVSSPVGETFARDMLDYWAFLAWIVTRNERWRPHVRDAAELSGWTRGLVAHHLRKRARTPGIVRRLRCVADDFDAFMTDVDVVLSPVTAHVVPPLGHLHPSVPFPELLERIVAYAPFAPLANVTGGPALCVPAPLTPQGLPVGVQLAAAHGDERTLLEVAYALEEARPFPRIQDGRPADTHQVRDAHALRPIFR